MTPPTEPPPTPVWLVRAGDDRSARGTLSIQRNDLVFVEGDGPERRESRYPLERVTRARRTRGSPVLTVRLEDGRTLLLYFTEPPRLSLGQRKPGGWDRIGGDRGLARTAGMWRLRAADRELRGVVEEWRRAIEERS